MVATVGIISYFYQEFNHMLFGDIQGNDVLSVYSISIVLASMMMAYHGILQSTGNIPLRLWLCWLGSLLKESAIFGSFPSFQTLGA